MTNILKPSLLLVAFALAVGCKPKSDLELTQETVNKNTIKEHIYFIASDELKGRNLPSEGLEKAGDYLVDQLKKYGVKPAPGQTSYKQAVPMKTISPPTNGIFEINGDSFTIPEKLVLMNGGNGDFNAPTVYVKFGQEADFAGEDVSGKIVIAQAGDGSNNNPRSFFNAGKEKRKLAAEKGAIALIELYNSPRMPWNFLKGYFHKEQTGMENGEEENSFPHLWLEDVNNELVKKFRKAKKPARLLIEGVEIKKFDTYNLVGVVEGTDEKLKEEYVMFSAHYDHVGIGKANAEGDSIMNGARDNAVGVVTVLSAAENIAKYPTRRSSLFVLFTGEEKGLLGSDYFANNATVPLEKVVYCFNSDNGGYNDTTIATIIGLERTTAASLIEKACEPFGLTAKGDPDPSQGLFDRSDNVNFAKKGIPAPTFSLGFTAFDQEIMKNYHQPSDNPETLDYDYLYKFFQSYVLACRYIANTDQDLFWVEGDKYYDAGKELYGRGKEEPKNESE